MGLLVVQALAVHRDATVAVQFLSLRWGCLVHGPAVGSLFILLAAVPPGTQGQPRSWGEDCIRVANITVMIVEARGMASALQSV